VNRHAGNISGIDIEARTASTTATRGVARAENSRAMRWLRSVANTRRSRPVAAASASKSSRGSSPVLAKAPAIHACSASPRYRP